MSDSPETRPGLLLSRDLFFNSKITGTAQALDRKILVAQSAEKALERLAEAPGVVFIDLAAGPLVAPDALARYRATAPEIPFIAFGSHVDTDALNAAREAGCAEVMPRSKFTQILPDLIRRYLP